MRYLFKVENPQSTLRLTEEQADIIAKELGVTREELEARHSFRGHLDTHGPYQIPVRYKALCVTKWYDRENHPMVKTLGTVFFGMRSMHRARAEGLVLEGRVSVSNHDYTAFTSHELMELPSGHLIDVGTIFVRVPNRLLAGLFNGQIA